MTVTPCILCGGQAHAVTETRDVNIGRRSVAVEDTFMRCGDCGEEFYLPGQMDETTRRATSAIRSREEKYSAEQIRAQRERLGLSQADYEQLLKSGPKTAGRWERGTVIQNGPVNVLMRLIDELPGSAELLAAWHGVRLASTAHGETQAVFAPSAHQEYSDAFSQRPVPAAPDAKIIDLAAYRFKRNERLQKVVKPSDEANSYQEMF